MRPTRKRRTRIRGEESANLGIADLVEPPVPGANRVEGLGRSQADNFVGGLAHVFQGFACGDGDRNHHAGRIQEADSADGSQHGGSGGEAVVHKNGEPIVDCQGRSSGTIDPFATLEFRPLFACDLLDDIRLDLPTFDNVVVQDTNTAACDGPERQFLVAGGAEFADEKDVEGYADRSGDAQGDGHSAAREAEDNGLPGSKHARDRASESIARIRTVAKDGRPDQRHDLASRFQYPPWRGWVHARAEPRPQKTERVPNPTADGFQ